MGGKGVCQEMGDNAAIFADETSMGRHDVWKRRKPVLIPAQDASETEEELDRTAEEIHAAQKWAGELLSLSTKNKA